MEELDAQSRFECSDMLGHHGLRNTHGPASGRKAADGGNLRKYLQACQAIEHNALSHSQGMKCNSYQVYYHLAENRSYEAVSNNGKPMIETRTAPYAALLLRVSLGGLFLAHAALKVFVFTPSGTAGFFASVGLPPALAYVTITAEVLGGLALILGVWTRVVAVALTPILLGAIFA